MVFANDHIFTRSEAGGVLLGASKSKGWEGVKTQPQLGLGFCSAHVLRQSPHPPTQDYLLKAKSVLNFIRGQEQADTPVLLSYLQINKLLPSGHLV